MTSRKNAVFEVVQGPDRLAILMAYAHYGKHATRSPADALISSPDIVYFVSKLDLRGRGIQDEHFYVTITGLRHADSTGKTWTIEARLVRFPLGLAALAPDNLYHPARRVRIHYHTDKKEGALTILPR